MLSGLILSMLMLTPAQSSSPRFLMDELTREGLNIPGGPKVKLLAPSLTEDLSAEKQEKVIDTFAEEFPPGLFLRKMSNAPYLLKVRSIGEGRDNRRGHTVDLWFIAYGTIEKLEKENVVEELLGLSGKAKKPTLLTDMDLLQRKIKRLDTKEIDERFAVLDANLIDKVRLSGVVRSQRQTQKKSLTASILLDERFADDTKYPNRWRSLKQKPGGEVEVGKPEPYRGFGGYVKVTELTKPAGALLIEMHFAFHEPHGWFQGYNVLASKLPLVVRDNVQAMRRRLSKK